MVMKSGYSHNQSLPFGYIAGLREDSGGNIMAQSVLTQGEILEEGRSGRKVSGFALRNFKDIF